MLNLTQKFGWRHIKCVKFKIKKDNIYWLQE